MIITRSSSDTDSDDEMEQQKIIDRIKKFAVSHIARVQQENRFYLYAVDTVEKLISCSICEDPTVNLYSQQECELQLTVRMCRVCSFQCNDAIRCILTPEHKAHRLYYKLSQCDFIVESERDTMCACRQCGQLVSNYTCNRVYKHVYHIDGICHVWYICAVCYGHSQAAKCWQRVHWLREVLLPELVMYVFYHMCELPSKTIEYSDYG